MVNPWVLSLSFASLPLLARSAALVDFQVAQPPPLPDNAKQCTIEVLTNTFGNSYGHPAIVQYTPPTDCGSPGTWAGISLNLTVTSNGTQYDRLGVFSFQNVEIWRTSTPEPVSGDGIIWTYLKDVTRYIPLFSEPGTFILELDNVLDSSSGLDGQYAAQVHATFYESSDSYAPANKSDLIIPISTMSNTSADDASVPPIFSTNVTLPMNAIQVYAELYASGNSDEEFWYYNVANAYINDFSSTDFDGDGPFREVRLLVDGQLAGVAFPYPVIFTGGFSPSAWMPITSYGALDLPTYFLDLTPFVPILADGNAHNISLDVVSAESDHAINGNWFVSGNLQVVTDPSGKPTTGNITSYTAPAYATTTTSGNIANDIGNITVTATHSIHIEAEIVSGSGETTQVVWSQDMQYSNTQYYTDSDQNVFQTASGTVSSTHNGVSVVSDTFSYPLNVNYSTSDGNVEVDHSYNRTLLPSPLITGSTITEHQTANGVYYTGTGSSSNNFSYVDLVGNTYTRQVSASDNIITYDQTGGSLAGAGSKSPGFPPTSGLVKVAGRFPGNRRIGV